MFLVFLFSLICLSSSLPLMKIGNMSMNSKKIIKSGNLMQIIMENKGNAANLLSVLDGANINPDDLDAVVVLVRALLKASEDDLAALTLASTQANTAYDTATSIHDAAVVMTSKLEKEATALQTSLAAIQTSLAAKNAEVAQQILAEQTALDDQNAAQGAKTTAQGILETETLRLNGEIASIKQVIELLTGLANGGLSKKVYKVDIGNLDRFLQEDFIAVGAVDSVIAYEKGARVSGSVGPLTVSVSGYDFLRGAYMPVTGGPDVRLSNMLRSSVLCSYICSMEIHIGGLTPGRKYSIKSYHHNTWMNGLSRQMGGGKFSLSWNGVAPVELIESFDGQSPNPATTFTADVTANSDGVATASIKKLDKSLGRVDINGLEITGYF